VKEETADRCRETFSLRPNSSESEKLGLLSIYKFSLGRSILIGPFNGDITTDPERMANHFNNFFTSAGKNISEAVMQVSKKAEDYVDYGRDIPSMLLGNTTPEHVLKVIKKFKPKNSCDIHGVSTKMIKFVGKYRTNRHC
jgi:hypothetical protein